MIQVPLRALMAMIPAFILTILLFLGGSALLWRGFREDSDREAILRPASRLYLPGSVQFLFASGLMVCFPAALQEKRLVLNTVRRPVRKWLGRFLYFPGRTFAASLQRGPENLSETRRALKLPAHPGGGRGL